MELLGKIAVKRNSKDRIKKLFLTIGLIAIIIAIIISLILEVYPTLVMIIPFLYLLNLRNKMGGKLLYKDVIIAITATNKNRIIEVSNYEYFNGQVYSARFTVVPLSQIDIFFDEKDCRINILCNAKKVLFIDNTVVPSFENQSVNIEFYAEKDVAIRSASLLETTLQIRG